MTALLWPCFALSGAAALGLEMLWMRSAGLVLGATAPTAAAVLASYFAGLALGAAAARGGAERPVRRYGLLELGAAAGAFWSLAVFAACGHEGPARLLAAGGMPAGVLAVAFAVLPSTLCLGATLPILGQALAAPGTIGRRGTLLYALNTAGGVLGIAAMGFGVPALIGVRASYAATAAASALAGIVALALGDRATPAPAERPAPVAPNRARLRAVAAGAGALGLGLEVLWTRLFAQVLHNSVYSFAAVSLVFLVALSAGAVVTAVLSRRLAPAGLAAGALLAAAVATVAGVWSFVQLTDGLAYVGMQRSLGQYLLRIVGIAGATVGPGALASGIVLPALWAAYGDRKGVARPLGDLAAANTLGAIAGALAAGFAVLPGLGLRAAFLAAAVAYALTATWIAPARSSLRPLALAALVAALLLDPRRAPLAELAPGEHVREAIESAAGVVTVVDTGDDLQLRLDNHYLLGGSAAATTERRQGLLPLLLHPAPQRVAFVGMATGISASAGPALGVPDTTVVELVPAVAAAAARQFATWNGDLLRRPGVHLVIDDGRRWLAVAEGRFDVVVSDLFVPWHAGAGTLYARETFEAVRRRLAPGGLFCQWLPLYQLTREEFDLIARTFLAVFPHADVWRDGFYADRPVVALVGGASPRPLDADRLRARVAMLPGWAHDPLLDSPRGLLMLRVGDLSAASDLVAAGPLNTDDRPRLEFLAPRMTRVGAAGDKDWFTGEPLAAFADALDARTPPASADEATARRAGLALARYALAARRDDGRAAAAWEAEVRSLVPEVVAAGDGAPPATDLADARRTLATLRAEQARVRTALEDMERRLRKAGR
jgi:spermidine synthase